MTGPSVLDRHDRALRLASPAAQINRARCCLGMRLRLPSRRAKVFGLSCVRRSVHRLDEGFHPHVSMGGSRRAIIFWRCSSPYCGSPFMSLNAAQATDATVALNYKDGRNVCTACPGPITTVRYQWQGDHVAILDPAPAW